MSPLWIWGGAALVYAAFRLWYDGIPRPLAAAEIDGLLSRLPPESLGNEAEVASMRAFLSADDGREFAMVNLVKLSSEPVAHPTTGEKMPARDVFQVYMKDFFPALLRRAGFPLLGARAIGGYVDSWNVPPDPGWTIVGYMRYRSRRDMMELVVDPRFAAAHRFKVAAMPVTFSFPTKPMAGFFMSPRAWVGLVVALVAALLHILLAR